MEWGGEWGLAGKAINCDSCSAMLLGRILSNWRIEEIGEKRENPSVVTTTTGTDVRD